VRNVTRVVEYPPAKLILRLFVVDLWANGRRRTSVGGAIYVIAIDRLAIAAVLLLETAEIDK